MPGVTSNGGCKPNSPSAPVNDEKKKNKIAGKVKEKKKRIVSCLQCIKPSKDDGNFFIISWFL